MGIEDSLMDESAIDKAIRTFHLRYVGASLKAINALEDALRAFESRDYEKGYYLFKRASKLLKDAQLANQKEVPHEVID